MNHRSGHQALRLSLALLAASAGPAALGASTEIAALRVAIHDTYYTVDGRRFDQLAALESAVRSAQPKSVEIDACGPNAARRLTVASAVLGDLPQRLRVLDVNAPACATGAVAMQASHDIGATPESDDPRVAAYWLQRMP